MARSWRPRKLAFGIVRCVPGASTAGTTARQGDHGGGCAQCLRGSLPFVADYLTSVWLDQLGSRAHRFDQFV